MPVDTGENWQLVNSDRQIRGRTHYYTREEIAPDNENEVYFFSAAFSRTLDGGHTLTNMPSSPGGDNHEMWIDPTNGDRMAVVNDGGISISVNRGRTWDRIQLPIAQIYHVTVDDQIPYFVYGNRQDGPSFRGPSNSLQFSGFGGDTIAESDLAGNVTDEYIFFAEQRIARRDSGGNVYYYFVDHLGSTRVITQAKGTTCYEADYTPYGGELTLTNTCPQNYKFTGYERDAETGLDYAIFRYYNSRLGRFMSPDLLGGAVGNPQSLNRYAYVVNSPTNLIDPLGLCFPMYWWGGQPGACPDPVGYWGGRSPGYCPAQFNHCEYLGGGFFLGVSGTVGRLCVYPDPPGADGRIVLYGCYRDQDQIVQIGGGADKPGAGSGGDPSPSNQNCTPSVFNPSCKAPKPPTCPEVFFKSMGEALDKFPVFPTGQGPEDAAKAAAAAHATRHIINRGLSVPLRSSIVRNILGAGEVAAELFIFLPVIVSEGVALKDEILAWRAGTCSTIWSKP